MRSGLLRCLLLLPLLAASPASRARVVAERQAPEPAVAASVPDVTDAVRPAAAITVQLVAREKVPQGIGGSGSLRPTLPVRGIEARAALRARLDLATWRASHAVAARGGVLSHFATAPPLHG